MGTAIAQGMIAPSQRGEFRRLDETPRLHVAAGSDLVVEVHRNAAARDFAAPGMTHHMLTVAVAAATDMLFTCGDATYEGAFRSGDLIMLPAGMPSRCCWHGVFDDALIVYFAPRFLDRLAEEDFGRGPARVALAPQPQFRNEALSGIGALLHRAAGTPGGRLLTDSLVTAMAAVLLRDCARLEPRAPRGALARPALARVQEHIEANLEGEIALADLAALAGCGVQHFKRAFRAATGQAPYRFVTHRRVERAKAMLAARRLTLAEIALACGFSSQAHFTQVFRHWTHQTPAAWRRACD